MKKERKQHSIDKLFLGSLAGDKIEPSPGIWESLSSHIPAKGGGGLYLYLLSAIAIGTFVFFAHSAFVRTPEAAAIHSQTRGEQMELAITAQDEPGTESPMQQSNSASASELEDTDAAAALDPVAAADLSGTQSTTKTSRSGSTASSLGSLPPAAPINTQEENAGLNTTPPAEAASDHAGEDHERLDFAFADRIYSIPGLQAGIAPRSLSGGETRESGTPEFRLNMTDSYVNRAEVWFGAGVSPAVNIYPEGQNRNDYSFEFVASLEKSRFIVESGIGVNFSNEAAKYRINYTSYDSVGYFIGVTGFTFDPENPDSIQMQTTMKSVYDSIDRFRIEETTNKYTYLQFPLRLGYRVISSDRFSVDLKMGVLFSLQVYSKLPDAPYPGSDAEQIEVLRQYPDRMKTNWQYTASIGLHYHASNHVRFSLEPFYRQYIKSVYSSGSAYPARSPFGFGLRGGIYVHF